MGLLIQRFKRRHIMQNTNTTIRDYKTPDTDALVSIWRAASAVAHPFLSDSFLEQEAENLRNLYLPNTQTWVLEDTGTPVGFIALMGREIGGLFLAPSRHGKGFGKAMVDHAVAQTGPLSVEVFERNAIGRQFYDRYGFVESARYQHEASGEMTLQMAMPTV